MPDSLIASGSPHLSDWLADETLFGLCCRHHVVSGNALDWQTSVQLFGVRGAGSWDFPRRLNAFVGVTGGILGGAEQIARRRTVLGFYLPFRDLKVQMDLVAAVRTSSVGSGKAKLGLMASGFGASHPLKACRSCMARDKADQDVASWRLEHQWPGSWICVEHKERLIGTTIKRSGASVANWLLPGDVALRDFVAHRPASDLMDGLFKVATMCTAIGRLPERFAFDHSRLITTYGRRVAELGFDLNGRLLRAEFGAYATRKLGQYRMVPEFQGLFEEPDTIGSSLLGILRHDRPVHHPLRHVAFILIAFGSWNEFIRSYQSEDRQPKEQHTATLEPSEERACPVREQLVRSVREGVSATAAARRHGVSVVTAIAWCADAGIVAQRRPSKFTDEKRRRAEKILRRGGTKDEAAKAAGVSRASISALLKTMPGLQNAHTAIKQSRARDKRRGAWNRVVRGLGTCTQTEVRKRIPEVFAWLYRYDRQWLEESSRELTRRSITVPLRVNWGRRDVQLAARVREAALAIADEHGGARVRRADLCEAIPDLKSRLSRPTLLPRTRAAVAEVTNRRSKGGATRELDLGARTPSVSSPK